MSKDHDYEQVFNEIRTDIKTLMVKVSAIEAKLPESFSCPVHMANMSQLRKDVDEHEKDIKWMTKKFYIGWGMVLVLIFIIQNHTFFFGEKPTSIQAQIQQFEPSPDFTNIVIHP